MARPQEDIEVLNTYPRRQCRSTTMRRMGRWADGRPATMRMPATGVDALLGVGNCADGEKWRLAQRCSFVFHFFPSFSTLLCNLYLRN
ncbi:hypothetical protein C2S53_017411 [Perilla frutescens var. hirtella]|uniref:Uncharacterized protein n=1 Tax=Perilla frutescens var. hirtella TaxID=608512 RepID=A0AAD4P7H2_PERFH|nr:hypothetical protein C2S53_017411 [Perilla frutescens var. hirtella]